MPRVVVLPSTVIDQIAAGEVIERPASVVKELVENALDAGALTIDVAIEDGGRGGVRVADDGSGMERDDALLALQRHATSKISDTADLVGVRSFGFRGEALPAIASVARLELATAPADGTGTLVRAEAGHVVDVAECARRQGTTVSVRQLFFNAPVRQRFLRSSRSEWRAVADVLATVALTRRDVRLSATQDGRSALTLPPAASLRARVAGVWGASFADGLIEVDDVTGPIHVSGLVERPADVGTAARRVYLAVNGRAIRDHGLIRAAESAYRSTIPAGARPSILLEVVVPADQVDVNVHPTKAEVRFRDRWHVEHAVEAAVRRALGTRVSAGSFGGREWLNGSAASHELDIAGMSSPGSGPLFDAQRAIASSVATDEVEIPIPELRQIRQTYVVFEHDEGLVLIDQHSAHERVLYERFMRMLERGEGPSQRLLFPLTLHLGPADADAFESHRELFERLGFEIEGFGGHTLVVRAVPLPHPRFDAERCLRESLDALAGNRLASAAPRHEQLAATVACKAAIKAGERLAPDEMRGLFVALSRTALPAHDVHGRATIVRLGWDEVERRFGRR